MTEGAVDSVVAVVVTYESAAVLPSCLDALSMARTPVIVIDNASLDGSAELASRRGAIVLSNARNEGYGRGNNRGVQAASRPWCLIVNPDVRIDPNCVAELLAAAARNPTAAIFGPRIVEPDGRVFTLEQSILADRLPLDVRSLDVAAGDRAVTALSGACLLVRREVFLRLGGFDPAIFLFYEDDDLCLRMRQAGYGIVAVDRAVVHHTRGESSAPTVGRRFRSRFHQAWSRSYVSKKHSVSDDVMRTLLRNGLKFTGAVLLANRDRRERYAGSVAGAWAALRGHSALAREGLE